MANLTNPALSLAANAGIYEALLVKSGFNVATGGTGTVPSATTADYTAAVGNVANAIMTELDAQLGAGFDTALASNATPGVTVAMSGAAGAAGAPSCGTQTKIQAMAGIARAALWGRSPASITATDYLTLATAIKAAYQSWLTWFTADAS